MAEITAFYGGENNQGGIHETEEGMAWEICEVLRGIRSNASGDMQVISLEIQIRRDVDSGRQSTNTWHEQQQCIEAREDLASIEAAIQRLEGDR